MKRLIAISLTLVCAFCLYIGSACISVGRLVESVRASNSSDIMARTNLPLLKQSLVDQIVGTYLRRIGQTKPVGQLERMAANTFGASIADAMLTKMLTAENLTELLKTGRSNLPAGEGGAFRIPPLDEMGIGIKELIQRLSFIQLRLLEFRLSTDSNEDEVSSISMHFEGDQWKLAGIKLPTSVVSQLAERLPVR